jgi:hypothetical protein
MVMAWLLAWSWRWRKARCPWCFPGQRVGVYLPHVPTFLSTPSGQASQYYQECLPSGTNPGPQHVDFQIYWPDAQRISDEGIFPFDLFDIFA